MALGVEFSESCGIPRVRLEAIVRCITQAVRSSNEHLIYDEGTLSLGLEFFLFLFWEV